MNNTPFLFALVLLIVLTASGESRAAQLFINELFHNDNFPETYTKPIPREEKPMLKPTKDRPKIALTFDDGPDAFITPQLLDILKETQVTATFFVLGEKVVRYPEMTQRIFDEGHLLANHSKTHQDMAEMTNEDIVALELEPTSEAVEKVTGYYPTIMRPPYGSLRTDSNRYLAENGWKVVRWSLDTFDWDSTRNAPENLIKRIEDFHHPNAVVLMHCNGRETVMALPRIIEFLKELEYEFVTVADL